MPPSKPFPSTGGARRAYTVSAGSYHLHLGPQTSIMGILNVTPDSFSGDGCLSRASLKTRPGQYIAAALRRGRQLVREGADILDVGGESSRPGARPVSVQEECRRVVPVIGRLAREIKIPISVDTYKSAVAQKALDAGASIVNNIFGTRPNKSLLRMVRNYNAAIVLMHMRGVPRTMQTDTRYANIFREMIQSLSKSIENCLEIGIKSDRIIIDPGIGFGKSVEQNLAIIAQLKKFKVLRKPILIGTSRKSFIGKVLKKEVGGRLEGSLATICAGILNGAHIVRVHDVLATRDVTDMMDALLSGR